MTHLRWPSERFFWSVLDAPGWTRAGPLPSGLAPGLEDDVPVMFDQLHGVCAPRGDNRVLVCAARVDDLRGVDALSLTPDAVPEFGGGVSPGTLNLLVGRFEPRAVRRARRLNHAVAASIVLACAGLAGLGFARRAGYWNLEAQARREAATAMVRAVNPAGPEALSLELAALRRSSTHGSSTPPDASVALAAVLAGWPAKTPVRTQSILVTPAGASIAVAIEGEPTEFIRSLAPPTGWTVDEPRINSADTATRVFIQMRSPHKRSEVKR